MLGVLKRRRRTSKHPTPEQAYAALSQGLCLYSAPGRSCSPRLKSVGLRDADDLNVVRVCSGHYGRLRSLKRDDVARLERVLREAFALNGR